MLSNFITKTFLTIAVVAMSATATSYAGWSPILGSDPVIFEIVPGNHLVKGAGGVNTSDTDIFAVDEKQNYTITVGDGPQPVDLTPGGGAGFIPVGTNVNSHLFYAQTSSGIGNWTLDLLFDMPILGVQFLGATLGASDVVLGDGGLYPTINPGGRQLEIPPDASILFGNFISLNAWQSSTSMDSIRVITYAPEPSTYMVLGGTLALVGFMAYRRKQKAA